MDKLDKLCRICLEDGANYLLFEKQENVDVSIRSKLSVCINEKIEDIEGYPRMLCEKCKGTLDSAYDFINKYRESCKILEQSLLIMIDQKLNNHNDYYDNSEVEIELNKIKIEPDDVNDYTVDNITYSDSPEPIENILKLAKPRKKPKKDVIKKTSNKKMSVTELKCLSKNTTNNIASSILEEKFFWNGEKWCMQLGNTTIKLATLNQKPTRKKKEVHEKRTKISDIPKKTKEEQPPPEKLCDICGEVLKNQERLSLHKKKIHMKNPVKCPECPRMCVSDYYLARHMKRKHCADKQFICSLCGKSFAFKGELTSHNRTVHNKDTIPKKVYSCKLCDKTYKCAKSVLVHERSVHTGFRPAICTVCDTSFYHEDYLRDHMRLHTGETPFKCPICGRGYAQRCNMKSHLRNHRISDLDAVTLSKLRPSYLKHMKM